MSNLSKNNLNIIVFDEFIYRFLDVGQKSIPQVWLIFKDTVAIYNFINFEAANRFIVVFGIQPADI